MRIVIGTPNFTSSMEADYAVNMARCIRSWSKKHEIHWQVVKRTFVCKARSMIVNAAHHLKADYIFWLDDDALIHEDVLDKLISHDKDIVITPYPMRRPPYHCGVLKTLNGNIEDQSSYRNLDWDDLGKGLIEVDGGGTHAMMTKMKIYGPPSFEDESIPQYVARKPGEVPYPWFVLAPFGGTEDMYFCLMAKRCGLKIYCDTDIEAGHVGYPQIITSGHAKSWKRKFGEQTIGDLSEKLPEGLSYIDVDSVESFGVTRITASMSGASADRGNGQVLGE